MIMYAKATRIMGVPVSVEPVGQLAIHRSLNRLGEVEGGHTLSHLESGYRVWAFEQHVSTQEIARLANMLAGQDFDAYWRGGCVDKSFVAACNHIYNQWDATYPDRLAWDVLSEDAPPTQSEMF